MNKRIDINMIRIDADTQARPTDKTVVKEFYERMGEGDQFPPVVIFQDGSAYYLADGYHRLDAAKLVGHLDIDAEVREGTREDALWFALGANRAHGKRLSSDEVRGAVGIALQTWPERTQQAIADQIGCSIDTVSRTQKQLSDSGMLVLPEKRTGADGKSRPTTYQKRRKPEKAAHEDVAGPRSLASEHAEPNGAKPDEPAEEAGRKTIEDEADSPVLARLKSAWQQATAAEREAFHKWIREER